MGSIIKKEDFVEAGKNVKPDARRRIVLPANLVKEDVSYYIYANSAGQIVLDPQVTIPASEVWLFEHREILESIDKGMAEKKVIDRGSFESYIDDEA
jgi:hypothetical protein